MQKIIGLSGYSRSGKDTLADRFEQRHGFYKISLADPIRQALYSLDPNIDYQGYRVNLKQIVDAEGWEALKEHSFEYRPLIQRMGMTARQLWGEDFWVERLFEWEIAGHIIVPDVRFRNEADAIRERGGKIWRIERPGVSPTNGHLSEVSMDGYDFDAVLVNDGSFVDFYAQAEVTLGAQFHA